MNAGGFKIVFYSTKKLYTVAVVVVVVVVVIVHILVYVRYYTGEFLELLQIQKNCLQNGIPKTYKAQGLNCSWNSRAALREHGMCKGRCKSHIRCSCPMLSELQLY